MKTVLFALLLVAGFCTSAAAGANIVIIVMDGANEGFNSTASFTPTGGNNATTLGDARLLALRYAAGILADCIESDVNIEIEARFDPFGSCTPTSGVLGYAQSKTVHRDFIGAQLAGTYYPAALANAQAGVDLEPFDADIEAVFNSDVGSSGCLSSWPWYYGLDGNTLDTDFVTVALHELLHGLGVQTFMNTSTGSPFLGWYDTYLRNLENHFASPADYPGMNNAQRAAGNIADPNLHWSGSSVTAGGLALTGGTSSGHVRMHGPSPLVPGSSVHHFSNALSPNELMEATMTGDNHDPGLALLLLEDIGWTVCNTTERVCDGATMDLSSPSGPPPLPAAGALFSHIEHGIYVSTTRDIDVCALGIQAKHVPGQTITATIYEANGNFRGAAIATGTLTVTHSSQKMHYVPIAATLEACRDYDLSVMVGDLVSFDYWDPFLIPMPYDAAGGAIRVRTAEQFGAFPAGFLFPMAIIASPVAPEMVELTEPAITWGSCVDSVAAGRGVYIHADETSQLSSVGVEAMFSFSDVGKPIRANVYGALGMGRGALVATGTRTIGALDINVLKTFHVPVSALLREGFDYDVEVAFPAASWSCWFEGPGPAPFDVGPVTVLDGEQGSDPTYPYLGRFELGYATGASPDLGDLVQPFRGAATALVSSAGGVETGIFVTALQETELYSVGWRADVAAQQLVVAQIYEAPGQMRGPLLATGFIESGQSGMQWHDIPIAVKLDPGIEYNIDIIVPPVADWEYWDATLAPGVPYNVYGVLQVLAGELAGASATDIPHLRVGACATTVVGIPDGPAHPPAFALTAGPNPVSTTATIRYSLDREAPVTLTVYDVAGRRVATLVDGAVMGAGAHEARFDANGSVAGVYFVRLQTPEREVSRKLVVVR